MHFFNMLLERIRQMQHVFLSCPCTSAQNWRMCLEFLGHVIYVLSTRERKTGKIILLETNGIRDKRWYCHLLCFFYIYCFCCMIYDTEILIIFSLASDDYLLYIIHIFLALNHSFLVNGSIDCLLYSFRLVSAKRQNALITLCLLPPALQTTGKGSRMPVTTKGSGSGALS